MKVDSLEVQIQSDAAKAIAELDRLSARLVSIQGTLGNINGNSFGSIGQSAVNGRRGMSAFSNSLKSVTKNADKVAKGTKSLAYHFGKFYASCFLAIRGIKALGKAVENSMDYIETYNYYNVIMDKIGTEFGNAWAENGDSNAEEYTESFKNKLNSLTSEMTGYQIGTEGGLYMTDDVGLGLDPQRIMNYETSISSVTNSLGLCGETSINTARAMTMLAADMSSLRNVNLDTVMTNLQSGLIGQSRALYKYGIDITNATLQTYAYKYGLTQAVSEMTQADKMQLRTLAILDQSKVAWGDMANTINGVANQYRVFQQQASNLARTIGNMFIPVLQKVLPYINAVTVALQRMFIWISNVLGIKWSNLMDGISDGYSSDDGVGELIEDGEGAEDALDGAAESAKKLKGQLQGFDELNNLSTSSTSGSGSGSSGGSGIDLSNEISGALGDYESIWDEALGGMEDRISEIADTICGFFEDIWESAEPARESFKRLWDEGLSKLANFAWGTLGDFCEEFLKPVGLWTLGTGLPRFFDVTNDLLNEINWESLRNALRDFYGQLKEFAIFTFDNMINFYESFLKPISTWTMNNAIPTLLKALTDLSKKINYNKLTKRFQSLFKVLSKFAVGTGQGLLNFVEVATATITPVLATTINVLASAFTVLFDVLNLIPEAVIEGIGFAIANLVSTIVGFKVAMGVSAIIQDIGIALYNLGSWVVAFPEIGIILGIAAAFGTLYSVLKDVNNDITRLTIGNSIQASLTVPGGRGLDEYASECADSIRAIGDEFSTLSDRTGELSRANTNIQGTWREIEKIETSMDAGVLSVEEGAVRLSDAFEELKQATVEKFGVIDDTLISAFGENGVLSGIFEELGVSTEETTKKVIEASDNLQQKVSASIEVLKNSEVGTPAYEEARENVAKYSSEYDALTKSIDAYKYKIDGMSIDYSKLFLEDGTANTAYLTNTLRDVTDAVADTKSSIDDSAEIVRTALQEKIFNAATPEDAAYFQTILDTLPSAISTVNADVAENATALTDTIQSELIGRIDTEISNAKLQWENMSFGEQLWYSIFHGINDSDSYVAYSVGKYQEGITEVSGQIETSMSELGIDGAGWGAQTSSDIINSIFDYDVEGMGASSWLKASLHDDYKSTIVNALEDAKTPIAEKAKEIPETIDEAISAQSKQTTVYDEGKHYVDEFVLGMDTNKGKANSATKAMMDETISGVTETDVKSKFKPIGGWIPEGLNEGISSNSNETVTTIGTWMKNAVDAIHDSAMNFGSPSKTAWDFGLDTVAGFNKGIKDNTKLTVDAIDTWAKNVRSAMQAGLGCGENNGSEDNLFNGLSTQFETEFTKFQTSWSNNFNTWKTDNDTLYFGYNAWFEQLENPLNAYNASWTSFLDLWKANMLIWWSTFVTPYFTTDQWELFGENMNNGITTGFKSTIGEIGGIMNKVIDMFNSALSHIESAINDLVDQFNGIAVTLEVAELNTIHAQKIKPISVSMYSSGGMPNTGELFMARENGINEYVGRIGNNSAVANNDQIVQSITAGVSSANDRVVDAIYTMANAVVDAVESGSSIYIGEQEVFSTVRDANRKFMKSTGRSAFT